MWPSTLMLVPLGIVMCMGMAFAFLLSRQARRAHSQEPPPGLERRHSDGAAAGFRPSPFDRPCRWAAVRINNAAAVQSALALNNTTPCCWSEILAKLDEPRLFVSPPVSGWTLVMGQALPDPGSDVDECFHFVRHLSRKLGQVQFFAVDRVLGHHTWAEAIDGRVVRAYAWAGETLWNEGQTTAGEAELGLRCYGYAEKPPSPAFNAHEPGPANSDKIFSLAARWSVDPTAIDELALNQASGIAGDR